MGSEIEAEADTFRQRSEIVAMEALGRVRSFPDFRVEGLHGDLWKGSGSCIFSGFSGLIVDCSEKHEEGRL